MVFKLVLEQWTFVQSKSYLETPGSSLKNSDVEETILLGIT